MESIGSVNRANAWIKERTRTVAAVTLTAAAPLLEAELSSLKIVGKIPADRTYGTKKARYKGKSGARAPANCGSIEMENTASALKRPEVYKVAHFFLIVINERVRVRTVDASAEKIFKLERDSVK